METKNCQKCKREFYIDETDVNFYQMVNVPHPTFCPECRLQRRLTFRNDRTLYKHTCDMCKKDVISIYRPNGPKKSSVKNVGGVTSLMRRDTVVTMIFQNHSFSSIKNL